MLRSGSALGREMCSVVMCVQRGTGGGVADGFGGKWVRDSGSETSEDRGDNKRRPASGGSLLCHRKVFGCRGRRGPAAGKKPRVLRFWYVRVKQHRVPAPDQVEKGDDDADGQNVVARFVEILCVGKKLLA